MLSIVLGAVSTGILRPLLTLTDTIQFLIAFLFALLPAAFVVATKGTRPLTCLDQLYSFLSQFPFGAALFSLMVGIASPYNASIRTRFLKVGREECQACLQDRPWLRNPFGTNMHLSGFNRDGECACQRSLCPQNPAVKNFSPSLAPPLGCVCLPLVSLLSHSVPASVHAIALANLAECTVAVGLLTAAQYEKGECAAVAADRLPASSIAPFSLFPPHGSLLPRGEMPFFRCRPKNFFTLVATLAPLYPLFLPPPLDPKSTMCMCVWCVRAYAHLRACRACACVLKTGLRVIPVKVECEYHKKGRGQITATAKYTLPADKKDAVVPYTTLLRKTRSTPLRASSPTPHKCRALHHPLSFDLL